MNPILVRMMRFSHKRKIACPRCNKEQIAPKIRKKGKISCKFCGEEFIPRK